MVRGATRKGNRKINEQQDIAIINLKVGCGT